MQTRDPACSTCTDDLLEPNDDVGAPRLDPGRVDGLKICPGNEDFYGVFARAGDTIDARIFFAHAGGDLDAALLDRVGAPDLTDDEVAALQQVLVDSGAKDHIEATIGDLTDVALHTLERSPLRPDAVDALTDLAHYVAARDL